MYYVACEIVLAKEAFAFRCRAEEMSIATAAGRGGRIIGLTLHLQSKGAEKVQIFQSASPRGMEFR